MIENWLMLLLLLSLLSSCVQEDPIIAALKIAKKHPDSLVCLKIYEPAEVRDEYCLFRKDSKNANKFKICVSEDNAK